MDLLTPTFLDERSPRPFRAVFGELLSQSTGIDTAILRIRLGAVDLSAGEVASLQRFRVLLAEVNARTVEEEAYALRADPEKRTNLIRIMSLLQAGRLELRSAPLGGWSPDFSVFRSPAGPQAVILGLHWFKRPFPHRGPAWATVFGGEEAARAATRFQAIWDEAHDIGPAVLRLLERSSKGSSRGVLEPRLPVA
jgi:hypothetical protein